MAKMQKDLEMDVQSREHNMRMFQKRKCERLQSLLSFPLEYHNESLYIDENQFESGHLGHGVVAQDVD